MPIFISVGADIISIHVPTRGTTDTSKSHFQSRGFQSTFPRGERRCAVQVSVHNANISIHVPTRGTTKTHNCGFSGAIISIHVPTRGTTVTSLTLKHILVGFQSTFPRGERRKIDEGIKQAVDISIHVPTRGTTYHVRSVNADKVFQSTFPRGERPLLTVSPCDRCVFQSTFPRGERRMSP